MSLEQLLLFLFFIGFPLLQRLIRAWTERANQSRPERRPPPSEQRERPRQQARRPAAPAPQAPPQAPQQAPRQTVPRADLPPSPPASVAIPPRPAPIAHAVSAAVARRARPEPRQTRAETRRQSWAIPHAIRSQWIGSPADLRRAIVLATILGPCRAAQQDDAPV